MKPKTKNPHLLPILTASLSLLFAAVCSFAALLTYDGGNYELAARAGMFAVIFLAYPFACVVVATLQAQESAFREQYPDYVKE